MKPTAQTPRIVTEVPGPHSRAFVASEARHLAPGVQSIATLSGLAIQRAEGSMIEDVDGNRFLDIAGGVCVNAVGHAHPRYRQILKEQIDEVTVGSFTTPRRAAALESVARRTPPGLDKIQLYSGGSEAVEAAMRLAKSYTKKYEFLSFWAGSTERRRGPCPSSGTRRRSASGPRSPGPITPPTLIATVVR